MKRIFGFSEEPQQAALKSLHPRSYRPQLFRKASVSTYCVLGSLATSNEHPGNLATTQTPAISSQDMPAGSSLSQTSQVLHRQPRLYLLLTRTQTKAQSGQETCQGHTAITQNLQNSNALLLTLLQLEPDPSPSPELLAFCCFLEPKSCPSRSPETQKASLPKHMMVLAPHR